MKRIILYQYQTPDISVRIEAFFKDEKLIIEGYDVGKSVDEWFGDSDYEYSTTLAGEELDKLFLLFHVDKGDKDGLLKAIAMDYNDNSCYSRFRKLLDENDIKYDSFSFA
ncbi:MAG: hypothetical protein MUF36_11310 [Bacteroidales bacterium]|jgi:hypothetical protein|nr:hypothetical protein [Bacteroidales bacterium]